MVFKEEHPLYERKSILTLDAGKRLSTVTGYQNVEVGDYIAILLPGPRMDGTYFAPRVEKNIAIDCEVCSPKDLRLGGRRHRRYLKTHRKALYTSLLTSDKLNGYLADIDRQPTKIILKKQGLSIFP